MNILDRIKAKAQQAIQGVGNFIDQDKSLPGIQLVKGGLGDRVSQNLNPVNVQTAVNNVTQPIEQNIIEPAKQAVQSWQAKPSNTYLDRLLQNIPTTPEKQQNINSDIETILGEGSAPTVAAQGFNNWLSAPLFQVPYNVKEAVAPDKSLIERGMSGLQAVGGIIPGADDALFAGYNAVKNKAAGGDFVQGLAGNEFSGIGDIAKNKLNVPDNVASTLNMAEIPLLLLAGGLKAKNADEAIAGLKRGAKEDVNALPPEMNYLKARGSKAADFIADESGNVSKVKEIPKSKAISMIPDVDKEVIETTDQLFLPSGEIKQAQLPAPSKETLDNIELNKRPKVGVQSVNPKSSLRKMWDDLVLPSKKVIEQSGPSGKKIRSLLETADEEGAIAGGTQKDVLNTAMKSLSKEEKATLADVIEGNELPSANQSKVAELWKQIADDIYNRAQEAGLDIGKIESYFPHRTIGDTSFDNGGSMGRYAPRRYGNLELSRETDMAYDKDPTILLDYINSANKRIAEAKHFGANDEVLYNLANQTAKEGGDVKQVNKYLDQILGKNQPGDLDKLSEGIRGVETVLHLNPGTSITNLTQNISTMLRTDAQSTAKAIGKYISNPNEAISNALKAGEIDANMARTLEDYSGKGGAVSKWLNAIGMLGTEKVNRIIAVNAGMEYTTKLAKQAQAGDQAAIRELARLGMTLDDIDALKGGRKISQATQFATRAGELPYAWRTAIGKVMTQFKSFAYKQSGLIGSEAKRIFQEFKAGNFKPLMNAMVTYGVAAPVAGEVVNQVKSIITNKEREDTDSFGERYLSNILAATSLGLLDSTGGLFGKYGESGVISTIAGPAASDSYKTAQTIANIGSTDEYDRNKAIRNIVNTIPGGVGKFMSNTFVPNTYVDNKDIAGINLGVNEGLGKEDAQAFKDMKATNPQQAELFKSKKQLERDQKSKEESLFNRILGGNKVNAGAVPGKGATAEERQAYNTRVRNVLDKGGIPTPEQLKGYATKGKDANSKSIEERTDAYKNLHSIMDNENYTDEQKQAVLEASGVKPENYEYYKLATKDADVRLQELMPKLDTMDDKSIVTFLMQGRRVLGGKQLITNAMVDYLYENDYIDENAKEAIKGLKYDEIKDQFYFTKAFGKKGQAKSLTYKQAKALFGETIPKFSELKSMSSLLKNYSQNTTQTGAKGEMLIEELLRRRPSKRKGTWF